MKKNSILDRLFHRNDGKKAAQAELRDMIQRKQDDLNAMRLELRTTVLGASLPQTMAELSASLQTDLDYSYLHPECREKLDSFISEALKLPALRQLMEQYEKATLDICSFCGNDEVTQAHELEQARKKMYRALGNALLYTIQEHQTELHPESKNVHFQQKIIFPIQCNLNDRFLADMATQEGEIYNPSSNRSLWGRLSKADTLEDIDDLWTARDAVYKASEALGLWRAVISVSSEMAQQYDLNRRESWKALMGDKINVIADELGIPQEDFRWVASWHGEEPGSPHVHIIWWDSSNTVQPQIMPDEKFKAMEERIRSSFEEGITNLKVPQLTSQEQAPAPEPEPELEDGEELEP